jgi:hypothetical protein
MNFELNILLPNPRTMSIMYTETPLKAKPIKARSHFEKTYESETSMMIKFFFVTNTS